MTTDDGTLVAEGTASIGSPGELTALASRDLRHDPLGLRILGGLRKGEPIGPMPGRIDGAAQSMRVEAGLVSEPLDWYCTGSPWGSPIAMPSSIIGMLTDAASAALLERIEKAVGLWGAFEICMMQGPVFVDTDYELSGRVVALGSSPKTENMWYDMSVRDGDRIVATMRNLTRFMKASSPLYGPDV